MHRHTVALARFSSSNLLKLPHITVDLAYVNARSPLQSRANNQEKEERKNIHDINERT